MMVEVLSMLGNMFQQILLLFFRVIDGLEAKDIVFGAFVVATIFRLLLVPLLGGRAPNEIKLSRDNEPRHAEFKDMSKNGGAESG